MATLRKRSTRPTVRFPLVGPFGSPCSKLRIRGRRKLCKASPGGCPFQRYFQGQKSCGKKKSQNE